MKREDIEKITKDMEAIGFEVMEIKASTYFLDASYRKILNGGYELKIMPIKKNDDTVLNEEASANGNKI
jgi:hypothetical protein